MRKSPEVIDRQELIRRIERDRYACRVIAALALERGSSARTAELASDIAAELAQIGYLLDDCIRCARSAHEGELAAVAARWAVDRRRLVAAVRAIPLRVLPTKWLLARRADVIVAAEVAANPPRTGGVLMMAVDDVLDQINAMHREWGDADVDGLDPLAMYEALGSSLSGRIQHGGTGT